MRLSGFTFLRNAHKLHYPILESIQSALDLVDEFVIALGDSDPDDDSRQRIEALNSDKIVLFDTVWDLEKFPRGMEHAHQTDLAKEKCTGDWLLYLQGDEVLHEKDVPQLRQNCERWLTDDRVEAMVFDYLHFWGDYDHVHKNHAWYKREIRLVRNDPGIHSFRSAQSFRRIPNFDGVSYRQKKGTKKLTAVAANARIFHYGWVRPPSAMQKKRVYFTENHLGAERAQKMSATQAKDFDYGPLALIPRYSGSHPAVMKEKIATLDWRNSLYETTPNGHTAPTHKHDRVKYRAISWLENNLFGGKALFQSEHFKILDDNPRVKSP
ncbi:MAG TPA: hypothetical protein DDW23_01785 [Planctomycetes bacterium]|nr:hypothetical protein [Planctomycetota bacterium]